MSYGLIAKNDSDGIQIDSTYRNFSLDQENDGESIVNAGGGLGIQNVAITSSPLVPLVLIRPNTNYFINIRAYVKSGNNFTHFGIASQASSTTSIDWRCYRENRNASGESYGLLVYNSSGELCFDSGKKYFRILAIETIDLAAPSVDTGPYKDITHSGVSDPFYILTPLPYYISTSALSSPPNYWLNFWTVGVKKLSSTSVRVGWFVFTNQLVRHGALEGLNPTMKLLVCEP